MESPAVPRKHIYDSERKKKLCRSSFVSPFPPHSRFLSNLWACYGSLIWASSKSAWPQRCDCGGGHYGSALGFRDDPGHGWHHKVSLSPPHTHTPHQSLPNSGTATRWQSWQSVILYCRHSPLSWITCCFQKDVFRGWNSADKKKNFSQQQLRDVDEKCRWEK